MLVRIFLTISNDNANVKRSSCENKFVLLEEHGLQMNGYRASSTFIKMFESRLEHIPINLAVCGVVGDSRTKHDQHVDSKMKADTETSEVTAKPKEIAKVPNKDLGLTNRYRFETDALKK